MSHDHAVSAPHQGALALGVAVAAVALCVTIWLALIGAPLGLVGLFLGIRALRHERRAGRTGGLAIAAVVLSALAVLSLPFLGVACNSGLTCV
jgi:Na+/H+-dicarboxylate symporter